MGDRLRVILYARQEAERPLDLLQARWSYLVEAEQLCEDIAVIRGGCLLARDSAGSLRWEFGADALADVDVRAMAA
jgi:hypothetical protein